MKIEVNIKKKYVFLILGVLLIVAGIFVSYAYTYCYGDPNCQVIGKPSELGHTPDEIFGFNDAVKTVIANPNTKITAGQITGFDTAVKNDITVKDRLACGVLSSLSVVGEKQVKIPDECFNLNNPDGCILAFDIKDANGISTLDPRQNIAATRFTEWQESTLWKWKSINRLGIQGTIFTDGDSVSDVLFSNGGFSVVDDTTANKEAKSFVLKSTSSGSNHLYLYLCKITKVYYPEDLDESYYAPF